eukprot:9311026-Ditylum_brightwellii.AAC.1
MVARTLRINVPLPRGWRLISFRERMGYVMEDISNTVTTAVGAFWVRSLIAPDRLPMLAREIAALI